MQPVRSIIDLSHRIDIPLAEWWSLTFDGLQALVPELSLLEAGGGRVLPVVGLRANRLLDESRLPAVIQALEGLDGDVNAFLVERGPMFRWSEVLDLAAARFGAKQLGRLDSLLRAVSDEDMICATCFDPSGVGLFVDFEISRDVPTPALERDGLPAALAHVAAAMRLRLELEEGRGVTEAVLSSDGKRVEHADGEALSTEARTSLRAAVEHLDRTRVDRSRSPLEHLFAQQAMVGGRWSLMDEFESDGKHFIFARVNTPVPQARLFPELSADQECVLLYAAVGHAPKYIAYELGRSLPSIRRALAAAVRRLGLATPANAVAEVRSRVRRTIEQQQRGEAPGESAP